MRALLALVALFAALTSACAQDAATLHARYTVLQPALASNAYNWPLHIESFHNAGDLRGEVHAVVQQPFAVVSPTLQGMAHWCDVLMLHLDVKMCRWSRTGGDKLTVATARHYDQPPESAVAVEFGYRVVASTADYLRVELIAPQGPLGTHDYRIVLEAIPLDAKTSFVHLGYAYSQGFAGRIAMEAYLATLGRNKVGFTVESHRPDGQPVYIGNVRGLVERNCMRYFLAIHAALVAASLPPAEQLERRLQEWYEGSERYPVQLHEMPRDDYLAMKRREIQQQQSTVKAAGAG
jgi:hypothetical protein